MVAPEPRYRAFVADDEPHAVHRLESLLATVDWVDLIGSATTGPATVEAVDRMKPDLLFLDIQMPGLSGVQVVEKLTHRPEIVFTTAFDRYAVVAFELEILDYLLKPFGERRFGRVMERALEHLRRTREQGTPQRARHVDARAPRRLFVRERGRIVPIEVAAIDRFEAQGDYAMIHTGGRKHLAHIRMKELEAMLDPDAFLRIHRKHLVNVAHIAELRQYDGHRLLVVLRNGEELVASRDRSRALRARVV